MSEPLAVREAPAAYQVAPDAQRVRPGYKQTEVGVIPEDWIVSKLETITDPNRTISYGIVQTGQSILNGIKCLRVVDIDNGKINTEDMITTSKSISDSYKRTILKVEDLVMPLRGKVGDIAIVGKDLAGSNLTRGVALIAIRSDWSARYCRQYISSISTRKRLEQTMNGSALQEIPIAALRSFKIALPPTKAEQEAIAETLSDADALIEALEQLIAKKRDLKQGAMQDLLTGKKRLPGFQVKSGYKQTEVGVIPVDWCIKAIEQISEVGRGRVISHKEIFKSMHSAYPVYSSQTSNNGVMGYIDTFDFEGEYITWTTDGANAGTVFHRKGRFNCTNVCGTIRLKSDDAVFVSKMLGGIAPRHVSRNLGNPKLMNDVVKRIKLPLPSTTAEQTAIATILSDMDTEIAVLEARLTKTRELKQGMMHNLLTGKIRLV